MHKRRIRSFLLCLVWVGVVALGYRALAQSQETVDGLHGRVDVICSYPAGDVAQAVFWSENVKESVRNIVGAVAQASGLRPNFLVGPARVDNAAAAIWTSPDGSKIRLIVYNPEWMDAVASQTQTDWAGSSIIAHEVGHHLQGHTILHRDTPGQPDRELEADEFSGFIIARMGGTLAQAQIAMRTFGSVEGSATHPPRHLRLAAIARGWQQGQSSEAAGWPARSQPHLSTGDAATPAEADTDADRPSPEGRSQAGTTATTCLTPLGDCRIAPTTLGAPCQCQTLLGSLPGEAH